MLSATRPAGVGERLKAARGRRGVTWDQLVESSGVHRATIARIEGGHVDPSRLTIWSLARALRVDPAWLAGFRDVDELGEAS